MPFPSLLPPFPATGVFLPSLTAKRQSRNCKRNSFPPPPDGLSYGKAIPRRPFIVHFMVAHAHVVVSSRLSNFPPRIRNLLCNQPWEMDLPGEIRICPLRRESGGVEKFRRCCRPLKKPHDDQKKQRFRQEAEGPLSIGMRLKSGRGFGSTFAEKGEADSFPIYLLTLLFPMPGSSASLRFRVN